LGFTFYSGAVEAWVVDELHEVGFDGPLDNNFSRGASISGFTPSGNRDLFFIHLKKITKDSIEAGWNNRTLRYFMIISFFNNSSPVVQ